MAFRVPRRTFLSGIGAATTSVAFPRRQDHSFLASRQLPRTDRLNSPFKIAIINDEISQDFGHACEVASREFGMSWIELRGMWDKNLLKLDAKEIGEAKRILEKNQLRVSDIASPLFRADLDRRAQVQIQPATRSVPRRPPGTRSADGKQRLS